MSSLGRIYTLDECVGLTRVIPRHPPISVTGLVMILVTLVGGAVTWGSLTWVDLVVRAPARVRASVAPRLSFAAGSGEHVFATIAGRVSEVRVVEGQTVAAGDVIAALDTGQLANDVAQLEAALDAARATRDAARRMQILVAEQYEAERAARREETSTASRDEARARRRARADVRLAKVALAEAERDAERLALLERDGAASRSQVEQAQARIAESRARVDAARAAGAAGRRELYEQQQALSERDWAVRREELARAAAGAEAEHLAAERRLATARDILGAATIRADVAGVIGSVAIGAGDPVQPGQTLFTITPAGGMRVDAAIAASEIAGVRVGMRVRVRLSAFDANQVGTIGGTIAQISSDTETLGAAGGGQAIVYIARIDLDDASIGRGADRHAVKLGMTGIVEVITGRERLLEVVLGRIRGAISL
jgi:multidrug resistance efflux pump